MDNKSSMRNERIIFACAVRNCEQYLDAVCSNIFNLGSLFKEYKIIFVESDSSDQTLNALKYFQSINSNIDIVTLGNLEPEEKIRTKRLSIARNTYLDIVETKYKDYDLLCPFDSDDRLYVPINSKAMLSNFKFDDWDMITANQKNIYYDMWALRHEYWMPYDVLKQVVIKRPSFISEEKANKMFSLSKRININQYHPPIKVESAFGGMALIKISSIQGARHIGIDEEGYPCCEWVPFCRTLKQGKANIFINPEFINGDGDMQ